MKELLEKYPDINAENIHAILQKEVGLGVCSCWKMPEFINAHQKEEKILCVLGLFIGRILDRDYNECCSMKYKNYRTRKYLISAVAAGIS